MPATVRGIYRPRRNKRKPVGQPKIIARLAPRGLIACCPMATGFAELLGHPVTLTGSPILTPTPFGYGQKTDHGTQCAGYQFPASASPNVFSLEILFYEKSATNDGSLVGWAATAPGTTSAFIAIYSSFPTWSGTVFDSSQKFVSGGDSTKTGVLVHLILTNDGAGNLRLYQDGVLKNTTTGITTLFSTATPFLNVGLGTLGLSVAWNEAEILLVNHANVAWTAAEIMARYKNPFGFLAWPEDRRHYLVGVASGATSYSFPTAGWVWNHQAPTLALASTSTQKAWAWNPQAPTLAFASTSTQKAWAWAKGAPSLGFASAATQKAWAWVGGAPILSRTIAAAQKAWRWAAASPTMTGGNFNPLAAVLRYLGPVWKRRRSRPPL